MSTTNGNMKTIKVTDRQGNVYILMPVDTDARQAIEEAKSLNFDDEYFTAEEGEEEVNIGLNGVPFGVEENTPLMIAKDDDEGFVLTCKALFGNNFCSEYNATTGTYNLNDYTIYQGKIYRCIDPNGIGTAEEFTASKWKEVVFLDYDLNDAPLYSITPYTIGKYCHHDGKLYRCTTTISSGETWNPAHWTEVERVIDGTLDSVVTKIAMAENFDGTHTYLTGDYCYYEGNLYKSKNDDAKPNFVSNQWIRVYEILPDLLSRLNAYVRKYDMAAEYDERGIYAIGDYCYHEGTLYRSIYNKNSAVLEVWNPQHWNAVPEILHELMDKFVRKMEMANDYNSSSTYKVGDYCYYENNLYKCSTDISTSEAWNSNHWTQVTKIIPELHSLILNRVKKNDLAEEYSTSISTSYNVGDYCYHEGNLYRCTSATSGGSWNSNNWNAVPEIMKDINSEVNNKLIDYVTKISLASDYSASGTYSVNDYCYYQGDLYRCISEANNEQWNANHWVSVSKLVADLTTLFNRTTSLNNDKAPVNHASQNTTYGIGTEDTTEGGATVYGNYGHVRISNETLNEYSTHEAGYAVGKGHKHSQYAVQSNIAENYSAAGTYEIGDICYHDGSLYQCSTAITVAEEWNINHWGLLPIKLVDKLIKKSATTGLVKNDGTIDSTNYLADTDMYSGMGSNNDGPMTQKAVYDYLGSHWFINDTSGARWYELLTVNNPDVSNTGAGELFAVGIKDADGNYNQALLSITSYGPNNEIAAKLINLNSFDTSYSTKVQLLILRNYSSNYTLYAKLGGGATINNAVKIKPIMCTGTISIGDSFEVSEPSGSVAIDNVTNLFTTTNGGIGNQLQPVYVYKQGLVAPCNTANMVVALTDIGGPLDTGDTQSSVIVEDNILVTKTSVDHPGNSINIQRLVLNKVYKVLFLTGTASDSQTMKLINFYGNSVHNMEIYTSNSTVYNTPTYDMIAIGSVHGASYTSHIMRTAQDTIYIIDGY